MKKSNIRDYTDISYDDLLIYALFKLEQENKHTTFENLVSECFTLFPKRFQLPGYPNWPDSSLIEKAWLRCRTDKGLLYGSKSKGFTLTAKGIELASKVGNSLKNTPSVNTVNRKDLRTRSGRVVKHVEQSAAFKKFFKDHGPENITDFEFCDLLYSTFDTEPALRKRNLEELKYHAEVYNRKDILTVLNSCEKKFSKFLFDPMRKNYEGGMMKKRKI